MFVYKNHRIHIAGFSYEIPDGYGLDQIQSEEYQNSLKMVSPDGSIVIAVRPYYRNMPGYVIRDAYSMLKEFLADSEDCFGTAEEIKTVNRCGLEGYCLSYKLDNIHYYEEKYDIPENEYGICVLEIVIEARKGRASEEVMSDTVVKQFWAELDTFTVR